MRMTWKLKIEIISNHFLISKFYGEELHKNIEIRHFLPHKILIPFPLFKILFISF